MELTTREAATRLGVNQSRVRALIADGRLRARQTGHQWLIDADSVTTQARLTAANATGRAMSTRIAWATAALAEGRTADWVTANERSRIRHRLRSVASPEVFRRWFANRATEVRTYRIDDNDLFEVLLNPGLVRTGVAATTHYNLHLSALGHGDGYLNAATLAEVAENYMLIETKQGNLTLRVVDHDWHLRTATPTAHGLVAPRLIVGTDLADDPDARTHTSGHDLLSRVLTQVHQ